VSFPYETGVEKGADVRRAFPVGADVEVIVLEADPSGRRGWIEKDLAFLSVSRRGDCRSSDHPCVSRFLRHIRRTDRCRSDARSFLFSLLLFVDLHVFAKRGEQSFAFF
jgi:hypothetical protein